jgi:predicted PhzF superfamily epimerase YddE/YHI9
MASALVILQEIEPHAPEVRFETRSGALTVRREGEMLSMDFPARRGAPCPVPDALATGLGVEPAEVLKADDLMAVLESEDAVRSVRPRFDELARLDARGVIVTAPGAAGGDADFVSRFFAPGAGVPEDPVTGSAHCTLVPYWSKRLGRTRLRARQVSRRGGELLCEDRGDRVIIAGHAVMYSRGMVRLEVAEGGV